MQQVIERTPYSSNIAHLTPKIPSFLVKQNQGKGIFAHVTSSPKLVVEELLPCDVHLGAGKSDGIADNVNQLNGSDIHLLKRVSSLPNHHVPSQLQIESPYQINAAHSIPEFVVPQAGVNRFEQVYVQPNVDVDDGSSVRSDRMNTAQNKRGKKPLESGVCAKYTDIVKFPQDWPHIAIQGDKAGGSYTFHELDFKLFLTGEVELISRLNIGDAEHDGRLSLMKQLLYLSRVYDFQTILKLYSEVVSNIEKGRLSWSSQFDQTIGVALQRGGNMRSTPKVAQQQKQTGSKKPYKSRPSFCKEYQSNSCPFADDKHWGFVKGEKLMVEHVCAACLMKKNVVAQHSESSAECPCKSSQH